MASTRQPIFVSAVRRERRLTTALTYAAAALAAAAVVLVVVGASAAVWVPLLVAAEAARVLRPHGHRPRTRF